MFRGFLFAFPILVLSFGACSKSGKKETEGSTDGESPSPIVNTQNVSGKEGKSGASSVEVVRTEEVVLRNDERGSHVLTKHYNEKNEVVKTTETISCKFPQGPPPEERGNDLPPERELASSYSAMFDLKVNFPDSKTSTYSIKGTPAIEVLKPREKSYQSVIKWHKSGRWSRREMKFDLQFNLEDLSFKLSGEDSAYNLRPRKRFDGEDNHQEPENRRTIFYKFNASDETCEKIHKDEDPKGVTLYFRNCTQSNGLEYSGTFWMSQDTLKKAQAEKDTSEEKTEPEKK